MPSVKMFTGEGIPLEMHKVRIVQKLRLVPIEDRLKAIAEAGNNTFLLQNCDVFLDMLTDSGVNAMSDNQLASMITADDAYAGSATFTRLADKLTEIFGTKYFLPAHQGRACRTHPGEGLCHGGQRRSDEFSFYDHEGAYHLVRRFGGRGPHRRGP